ncbi:MAG: HNH endonuclease [Oxalobacter formigenes]|nr:HNH endonuclease [Oxalobacter formigenes]
MINVDEYYNEEKQCIYKNETYLVRNNGAVLRYPKNTNRIRLLDNKWTFGRKGDKGYLYIAGVQIHRIVATAFHGIAPSAQHVVDHKDTNRQNNRPENLHWVTRLENALENPITRKKIIAVCGSVEAFLENPSRLGESQTDINFSWMRSVIPEEAKISMEKLEEWAKSDAPSSGGKLGDWIYKKTIWPAIGKKRSNKFYEKRQDNAGKDNDDKEVVYIESLTLHAVQANWKTPTKFPCCPQKIGKTPLEDYLKNLQNGKIFCINQYNKSEITKFGMSKDMNSLIVQSVHTENSIKPWYVYRIAYKNDLYVHEAIGSYFQEDGADKYYTLALGEKWEWGDVFDDFC